MNLMDDARLTEVEKDLAWAAGESDAIADAATSKALWACVDWLREYGAEMTERGTTAAKPSKMLAAVLEQAGIERPRKHRMTRRDRILALLLWGFILAVVALGVLLGRALA